jgi:N4-gp56 family major capsid protein
MANTSGSVGGTGSSQGGMQGWDAAVNTQPIPMSLAGTTAAGVAGAVYNPNTSGGNTTAAFNAVVSNLVIKTLIENLRSKPILAQIGNYVRAKNVPGTKGFVYTAFADLSPAVPLLEGVPPETEKLQFDSASFFGGQKGKLVAITDLADLISPFDLYSTAAEKVAWNIIDTLEKDLATLLSTADNGIGITSAGATCVQRIVDTVTAMKIAEVPMFPDGTYHAAISPTDASKIMAEVGELGWTDVQKYANPDNILNGEIGKFRGIRFMESTRILNDKSIIYGPEFFAWGDYQTIQSYRVAPGGDHADPLAQRGLLGWKGMWGLTTIKLSGTPPIGPASNTVAERWTQTDLTP